jgi:catechol 2,3-dioxygenase-like lactoylglutathione lyase family enzyme
MTTPLQGLRTVIHPVDDLDAAKRWWTELLGFGPYFETHGGEQGFVSPAGVHASCPGRAYPATAE